MPARAEEAGTSLIEVLIAIAIMGISMVAILGALGTQIAGGRVHRDQSNAAAVVTTAAEAVKAAAYQSTCGSAPSSYLTAARGITLPTDWVTKGWTHANAINPSGTLIVRYWNGTSFTSTCNDNVSGDAARLLRVQEVEIVAVGPEGDQQAITILKSGQP